MSESEEYVVTVDRDIHGELIRASDGTPLSAEVTYARWKHRLAEAMCDRYPEEPTVIDQRLIAIRDSMCGGPLLVVSAVDVVTVSAGGSHEPACGDCEDRSGVAEEVQPAEDVGQAESET